MVLYKILIVEDDAGLALPLKDFFEDNDFEVLHVISGEEAVEVYGSVRPSIVLLDIILPGISGFEVMEKIREMDNSIPIIMMTGTESDADSQMKGYGLGAVNYIQKPVIPRVLLAQIKSLLNPPDVKRYILGDYNITIRNRELSINNSVCTLKEKDIHVLSTLLRRQNEKVSRRELLLSVWKEEDSRLENLLDSSISRIKRVLKKYPNISIKSVYGEGYIISIDNSVNRRKTSLHQGDNFAL